MRFPGPCQPAAALTTPLTTALTTTPFNTTTALLSSYYTSLQTHAYYEDHIDTSPTNSILCKEPSPLPPVGFLFHAVGCVIGHSKLLHNCETLASMPQNYTQCNNFCCCCCCCCYCCSLSKFYYPTNPLLSAKLHNTQHLLLHISSDHFMYSSCWMGGWTRYYQYLA